MTVAMPGGRAIRFRVLGSVEFFDGRYWRGVAASKQRCMLAVLLLNANRVVPTDRMIAILWSDKPPASVRSVLIGYAWRLRKLLGDPAGELLVTKATGYQLVLPAGSLDVELYEERAATGQAQLLRGELAEAVATFDEALGLFQDVPYADVPGLPAVMAQRTRLENSRITVLESRTAAELMLGRHEALLPVLTELVGQHPLRERLCAHLMLALYRSLNQAEALTAYRTLHGRMVEELGIEPSQHLRELHQMILRGDARLMDPASTLGRAAAVPPATEPVASVVERAAAPLMPVPEPHPDGGQLDAVTDLLLGADRICIINGLAGAGKTTLALQAAHRVAAHFPGGSRYLDLFTDPVRQLAAPAERSLLVLDNVWSPEHVRTRLPLPPGAALLVVSRCAIGIGSNPSQIRVDPMSAAGARDMLRRALGPARVAAEPAEAGSIVRSIERLPLALQICASWLASRPNWRLADFAARLAQPAGCLEMLTYENLSVRASLSAAVEMLSRGPDGGETSLLRLLGSTDLPVVTSITLAVLTGRTEAAARGCAERLVDAGLLESLGFDRYRVPRLLRLFLAERVEEQAEAAVAVTRVTDHYAELLRHRLSATVRDSGGTAQLAAWYRTERDVLRRLADRAPSHPLPGLLQALHGVVRPTNQVCQLNASS